MSRKVLPLEIWGEIFSYACLDNGYTGRSLSMVSKEFCTVSAPYKYQSISIKRAKHIFPFAKVLKEIPPHLRRVHHLLLATPYMMSDDASDDERDLTYESEDEPPSSDESDAEETASEHSTDVEHDALTHEEDQELQDDLAFFDSEDGQPAPGRPVEEIEQVALKGWEDNQVSEHLLFNVVDDVITMCSPTLTSLCLCLRTHYSYGAFLSLPCALPRLRELQWAVTTGSTDRVQRKDIPIPSLETITCSLPTNANYRARIMQLCPDITFLCGGIHTGEFWEVALRNPPYLDNIPTSLTEYWIDVYSGDDDDIDESHLRNLENEMDFSLLDRRIKFQSLRQREIADVEKDWLNRLNGGIGIHHRMPFPILI